MVELQPRDPPATTLSLAAALAVIEAVDVAAPGLPLMLKWPNDLRLAGDKLAGILLERSGDRIIVGFGVNLASAPDLADRKAASLRGTLSPQGFAPLLAQSFVAALGQWRSGGLAGAWLKRAHPVGSPLTVHISADEQQSGTFDGLEPDGALRLRTAHGVQIVRAGDVSI